MAKGESQQPHGGQLGKGRAAQQSGGEDKARGAMNPKMKMPPISEVSHSINSLAQSAAFYDVLRVVGQDPEGHSSGPPHKRIKTGSSKDLVSLAQKSVTPLDGLLKQAFCQKCGTVLIPGLTSRTRTRSSGPHQRTVSTTCTTCQERSQTAASPQDAKNKSGLAEGRRLRKKRRREQLKKERDKEKEAAVREEASEEDG
ncbi:unnamed protein product [Tilletia controversa]|uniref:Rpr2-domain-containing protein n=3 Tax=Tilletia TaxID=13289 RepID=A0A8X7MZH4_9BASI|nr:hypothetical protein CF336_g3686 [Tilletia laevis]KAE8205773.1 hypothetical protein CF328_g293 [Tilletia controversa]KAE8261620.1 hypothetical protein A4X03_0g3101 [Tilletia caries]KAE8207229.1 hypothetical protein CF335_g1293 [Tilletia laevis]KAE8254435.1 hypothetical protein A4X06_0g896 [Tilletia controversa]